MAPRDPKLEALKAEFIQKKGVTRVDDSRKLAAERLKNDAERRIARAAPKVKPIIATPAKEMGTKPKLMWVSLNELHIDPAYQRAISTRRGETVIRSIAEGFQWKLFQPLTITNRKGGGYWVIDGQHRVEGARLNGNLQSVPAMFQEGLTRSEQAAMFTAINANRVSVNALSIHHAKVAAGDPEAVALQKCCDEADVVICRYPKMATIMEVNETMAIGVLKTALKRHGSEALIRVLKTMRRTYHDMPGMLNALNIKDRLPRKTGSRF